MVAGETKHVTRGRIAAKTVPARHVTLKFLVAEDGIEYIYV
jgi:hypothetical protein